MFVYQLYVDMHGIRPNFNGTQFSGVKFNNCYHYYSEENILLEINISFHEKQKCIFLHEFVSISPEHPQDSCCCAGFAISRGLKVAFRPQGKDPEKYVYA